MIKKVWNQILHMETVVTTQPQNIVLALQCPWSIDTELLSPNFSVKDLELWDDTQRVFDTRVSAWSRCSGCRADAGWWQCCSDTAAEAGGCCAPRWCSSCGCTTQVRQDYRPSQVSASRWWVWLGTHTSGRTKSDWPINVKDLPMSNSFWERFCIKKRKKSFSSMICNNMQSTIFLKYRESKN